MRGGLCTPFKANWIFSCLRNELIALGMRINRASTKQPPVTAMATTGKISVDIVEIRYEPHPL